MDPYVGKSISGIKKPMSIKSMIRLDNKSVYRMFTFYLAIGAILLYCESKMYKKEKKYIRIIEFQLYPLECIGFNVYTFDEFYNDLYLNKIVKNIKRVNELYLDNCKPLHFDVSFKTWLRYCIVIWIFFGMLYAKLISDLLQTKNKILNK